MKVLLHTHCRVWAVDDKIVGVIEMRAESLGCIEIVAQRRVDEALIAL